MIFRQLNANTPEPLPAPEPWTPTLLFETVRVATTNYQKRISTRAWTCQVLVDQLTRISAETARGTITMAEANLLTLTVFQHLEMVRRFSRGLFFSSYFRHAPLVLRGLRLERHMLTGLRLRAVTFHSCDLTACDLSRGQFRECRFIACSMDEADLTRVRFRRCDFRGCSFRRGILTEADFRTCHMLGCNLEDATSDGSKGLLPA